MYYIKWFTYIYNIMPIGAGDFFLVDVTATLTIVHFVWFRDFSIPGEISFQNIKKNIF